MTSYAPLALFVFRRPKHTRLVLDALQRCPELANTPLHIFADGARHDGEREAVTETRRLVTEFPHSRKHLVLASTNMGLATSIINGVTTLCAEYGRVIVLEDDLIVSPSFLNYMNRALDTYEPYEQVCSINGYNFGDVSKMTNEKAFFLRYTHPWGWATWHRAWRQFDPRHDYLKAIKSDPAITHLFNLHGADNYTLMLRRQQGGELDSWWIRWYANIFLSNSLGLFPPVTMTRSIGADRSATHTQFSERLLQPAEPRTASQMPILPEMVVASDQGYRAFRMTMRPRLRRALRVLGSTKRLLLRN